MSNPYPGLRPFNEEEAHLFFGREKQVDELLDRLQHRRFLAVVGVSGSGKSSLVRAGLLPALHLGGIEDVSGWRIAVVRPGMDPIGRLVAELAREKVLGPNPEGGMVLESSSRGLAERALRANLPDGTCLLIVVDQFEEIFTYRRIDPQGPEYASKFVKLLLEAVSDECAWSHVHVVLTMRSDFLGRCSEFRDLPEALNDSQYLIPRMTRDERRQAIEQPALSQGVPVAPRLIEVLLNDAGDEPQRLPVLQHALMRIWDEANGDGALDLEHYRRAGGIEGALDRHTQKVYDKLSANDKTVARRVFQRLAYWRHGFDDTRRPTRISELCAVTGASFETIARIYRHFSDDGRTILYCEAASDSNHTHVSPESVIDITHESLLHHWKEIRLWIDRERELGRQFLALAECVRTAPDELLSGGALGRAQDWLTELKDGLPEDAREQALQAWSDRYRSSDADPADAVSFSQIAGLIERSAQRERADQADRVRVDRERRAQEVRHQRIRILALVAMVAVVALAFPAARDWYDHRETLATLADSEDLGLSFRELVKRGARDFGSAKLARLDAVGVWAGRANFTGADLAGAQLDRSYLLDGTFTRASLPNAQFSQAVLVGANFAGSNLKDANLKDADLRNVDFTGAILDGAVLTGADVEGAKFDDSRTETSTFELVAWWLASGWTDTQAVNLYRVSSPEDVSTTEAFRKAKKQLDAAIAEAADKNRADRLHDRARFLAVRGFELNSALEDASAALQLRAGTKRFLSTRGYIRLQQGACTEAERDLRMGTDDGESQYHRALAIECLARSDKSEIFSQKMREHFDRARALGYEPTFERLLKVR